MYIQYGNTEIEYLKSRDKFLCEAICKIGYIKRTVDANIFSSVIHHIIGQQISVSAQLTIWNRLCAKVENIQADIICLLNRNEIQSLGMTFKKADYIIDFAKKVQLNEFDIVALNNMSDIEVIKALSTLKGIGVWTAEMIMTFCMQRPNVISFGDLAIHRGMRMLYHHRSIDKKKFAFYTRRYSPYATVASLYLWAIAGGAIPEMNDYAPKKKKEIAKRTIKL